MSCIFLSPAAVQTPQTAAVRVRTKSRWKGYPYQLPRASELFLSSSPSSLSSPLFALCAVGNLHRVGYIMPSQFCIMLLLACVKCILRVPEPNASNILPERGFMPCCSWISLSNILSKINFIS